MPTYSYIAIDQTGKQKKGKIEAADIARAQRLLKQGGLVPVKVSEPSLLDADVTLTGRATNPRDLAVFCTQMVSLLKAGVPLVDSFEMMSEQTENKVLKQALAETTADVRKGESLGSSMKRHPEAFPMMLVNMVEAGEASGSIENSFQRMGVQFESDAKITGMIKKAMVYPCIVVVVAIVVVIVMLKFVIPNYITMFDDLGTSLPGITLAVIAFSNWMSKYWLVVIAAIVVLVVAYKAFAASEFGQVVIGRVSMKLPLVGPLVTKTAASRFARTMSTLLSAGISIMEAIEITKKNMPNVLYKDAMAYAKDEVSKGTQLSQPIEKCGLFPPMICHMVKIGEDAGNIEEMLDKSAAYYEEEVEAAIGALMAAMEPAIIIVLAGICGVLIAAVMAPMATMYSALDNI